MTGLPGNQFNKVPPSAIELEQAVLGAMMLERDVLDSVSLILTPDCFYREANQMVCRIIYSLNASNKPTEILMVVEALRASGELESVGGAYYISTLTNSFTGSVVTAENYAKIIFEKFMQREMIRVCSEVINEAYREGVDAFDLMNRAEQNLFDISSSHLKGDMIGIETVLVKSVNKIEEWRKSDSTITGIPSGFPKLDLATRGWQPGDLIIVGARPSVGKTALALHLVKNATIHGSVVGIWSLEMEATALALRMISAESEMHLHRIQTGRLDNNQMAMLHRDGVMPLANRGKIFFDDSSSVSLYSLRAKARRLKKKHKLGLILIDYLQLMEGEDERNREREISKISRGLKMLAKELQVPIIALSQLSREQEKRSGKRRQPQLSDLRESGAIEQDADVVIFLWGPEEEEIEQDESLRTRRYAKIAKQRNGSLASLSLEFKNEIQVFREIEDQIHVHQTKQDKKNLNSQFPSEGKWKPIQKEAF